MRIYWSFLEVYYYLLHCFSANLRIFIFFRNFKFKLWKEGICNCSKQRRRFWSVQKPAIFQFDRKFEITSKRIASKSTVAWKLERIETNSIEISSFYIKKVLCIVHSKRPKWMLLYMTCSCNGNQLFALPLLVSVCQAWIFPWKQIAFIHIYFVYYPFFTIVDKSEIFFTLILSLSLNPPAYSIFFLCRLSPYVAFQNMVCWFSVINNFIISFTRFQPNMMTIKRFFHLLFFAAETKKK